MPQGIVNAVNNPVLTQIVQGYTPTGFIRDRVLPEIKVTAYSGDILVAGDDHLRIQNDAQVGAAETPLMTWSIEKTGAWNIKHHGLKAQITLDLALRYNNESKQIAIAQFRNLTGKKLKQSMMLHREDSLALKLTSIAGYVDSNTVTLSGVNQWNDRDNSDPLADFKLARTTIYNNSGLIANTALLSWNAFECLRHHPDLISMLSNAHRSDRLIGISEQQLALLLGVNEVLVGTVMKNTADQGLARVNAPVWGNDAVLFYKNPNPRPEHFEESLGYRFLQEKLVMHTWEENDPPGASFVRAFEKVDDKILSLKAAYLIKDAVA